MKYEYEVIRWVETSGGPMGTGYDQPLDPPELFDTIPKAIDRIHALVDETGFAYRWRHVDDSP